MHSTTRKFFIAASLIISLTACSSQTGTGNSAQSSAGEHPTLQIATPENGTTPDSLHGQETGIAITALNGKNGALANGAATAFYYTDKGTAITIQLNIASATVGKHYNAWVTDPTSEKTVSLGILESTGNDVRHSLRFDSKENLQSYTNITISLQPIGGDTTEGPIAANGILKGTKR